MTEHCYWRFSRALHRAINDQCFAEIEDLLDKHVEWALNGPIDMFPFLGSRHGKHAVLKVIRHLAGNIQVRRFDREMTILGLDSAASICAVRLVTSASGKPIVPCPVRPVQGRPAHQYARAIDTFDLVEQVFGRSIHLPNISGCVAEGVR